VFSTGHFYERVAEKMREKRPATKQVFTSLGFSEESSGVLAQRKPCCAASRDNLSCPGTTPMDAFNANAHEFHTVSGNDWERYSE
jgi:hypothetical protein